MRIKGADIRLDSDGTVIAPGGGSGTVTSIAVSGSDGVEVDSGSPVTTSGTIALGVHAANLRAHINVENGADVTDATNVAAAGALMAASNLSDVASAATARNNLGLWIAETTVASATTTDLGAVASDHVSITGTTTITGFGTVAAGTVRSGRFTGALTLTHHATSLILPGGANITTAAGDRFGAISLGSGNWVVYWYTRASGAAVVASSPDAAAVTYTPTTNADWDSSTDPGDVDDALDQLAERTKDLEGASSPLNNHAASVPPTANDDSGDGYSVGSAWTDTALDEAYQCADATPLAAVWNKIPKRQVRALTSDNAAVSSTSFVDVVGFTFPILASKDYYFDFALHVAGSATTVGIDVAVNGPSSPTLLCYEQVYWTSATARVERCATAYDNNTAAATSAGTAEKVYRVRGTIRNGSNAGNLTARVKVDSGTCTVKAGSFGVVERLVTWPPPPTLLDSAWFVDLFTDSDGTLLDNHTPTGPNVPSAAWGATFWIDGTTAAGHATGDSLEIEIASNAIQVDGSPAGAYWQATPLTLAEADVEMLYQFEAAGGTIDLALVGWLTDWVDKDNYEMCSLHISAGTLYKIRYGSTSSAPFVTDVTSLGAGSWPLYLGMWHVGTSFKMALFNAAPPAAPVLTATYTLGRTPGNHHGVVMANVASGWRKPTSIYVQPAGAAPTWELF